MAPSRQAETAREQDGWGSWYVRRHYSREGYNDDGEAAALALVEDALRTADVLDIGVGGGRTTTLLAGKAQSYLGVDISPGMIELARERHPGVTLEVGDARRLDGVDRDSRDIVLFSNNGIDAVGHHDRPRVLEEVARVLRPGGWFLFSTFNEDGGTRQERPDISTLTRPTNRGLAARPAVFVKRSLDAALGYWHFRRSRAYCEYGEDWSVVPLRAHEYRFAVHFIRLRAAIAQLEAHGFDVVHGWGPDGAPIDLAAGRSEADWMTFAAKLREPGLQP